MYVCMYDFLNIYRIHMDIGNSKLSLATPISFQFFTYLESQIIHLTIISP